MLYDYQCASCQYFMIDVYQSIHDAPLDTCPNCDSKSLERIISGGLGAFVKDVKTIGQLADHNWKKLGSYEKSDRVHQDKRVIEEKPQFYGNASKSQISKMTEAQKQKYIITGET